MSQVVGTVNQAGPREDSGCTGDGVPWKPRRGGRLAEEEEGPPHTCLKKGHQLIGELDDHHPEGVAVAGKVNRAKALWATSLLVQQKQNGIASSEEKETARPLERSSGTA